MDKAIQDVDAREVLTSSIWPTDSTVRLLSVPWDSDYRDVVAWESAESRDDWFAKQSGSWYRSNFQNLRPGEPINVPVPYSSVYQYNYIVVSNPQQPVEGEGPQRSYFYFITGAEYLSPQASRLTVQLDVMTTYAGAIEFGRAFVVSGHIAMANANARGELSGAKLLDYMSLPEGIDCGSELVPCKRTMFPMTQTEDDISTVIVSTARLEADPGTTSNPTLRTADGQTADGLINGCNVYAMNPGVFLAAMQQGSDYSWVTQCIIAIYSFPTAYLNLATSQAVSLFGKVSGVYKLKGGRFGQTLVGNTGNVFANIAAGLGDDSDLAKLYSYPYSVIEMSTFSGNPIYLKPQLVWGNDIALYALTCALVPFAKIGVFPSNYGAQGDESGFSYAAVNPAGIKYNVDITAGDFLDTAAWITDFPQYSIVNNNYITQLASSAHTRAYNYQSAGWQLTKGMMQNQATYANAMDNAATQQANAEASYAAQSQTAENNRTAGWVGVGAGVIGTVAGAAVGGLGTPSARAGLVENIAGNITSAVNTETSYANANIMNSANLANTQRSVATSRGIADRNQQLGARVAQGDYKNAIASINASVQDAALTPPSTVGQAGGQGFNWRNGLVGVCVTYKTITGAAKSMVADYFRRYGYRVQRFLNLGTVRHMLCMSKFAYWSVLESNLTCARANESERNTMRGVVEKGVTLWDAPESIGKTDPRDNQPRDGYSY